MEGRRREGSIREVTPASQPFMTSGPNRFPILDAIS